MPQHVEAHALHGVQPRVRQRARKRRREDGRPARGGRDERGASGALRRVPPSERATAWARAAAPAPARIRTAGSRRRQGRPPAEVAPTLRRSAPSSRRAPRDSRQHATAAWQRNRAQSPRKSHRGSRAPPFAPSERPAQCRHTRTWCGEARVRGECCKRCARKARVVVFFFADESGALLDPTFVDLARTHVFCLAQVTVT